ERSPQRLTVLTSAATMRALPAARSMQACAARRDFFFHLPKDLMQKCNRHNVIVVAVAAALATLASTTTLAAANSGTSDSTATAVQTQDTGRALVMLNGDPLSTYVKTKPQHGKKIDFTNSTTKSYRAQLS